MIRAFLLMIVVMLPTNSVAQSSPIFFNAPLSLGLITQVYLVVSDQITENCWTNADNIKANVRLKFEQNDIEVLQYEPSFLTVFHPSVFITGYGLRAKNGRCIGNASFKVLYFFQAAYNDPRTVSNDYIITGNSVPFEKRVIFAAPRNLNNQFSTFFDTASSELIADILTARRNKIIVNFKQVFPSLADKPMSMDELEKKLKDSK